MGEFDPVPWEAVEAANGPPAREVTAFVRELENEVTAKDPYETVKTIHDALYDDDIERTVPNLGEPFITAYLLEQKGIITPSADAGKEYQSIVERRPETDRLEELFWKRERTLWWIGLLVGVHPSVVTYWFYEDNIPLMERNFTEDSLEQIRAYRESKDG